MITKQVLLSWGSAIAGVLLGTAWLKKPRAKAELKKDITRWENEGGKAPYIAADSKSSNSEFSKNNINR